MLPRKIKWCPSKPLCEARALELLAPSVATGQLTNNGPADAAACEFFKAFLGVSKSVVMAASGTAALHAACAGLNMQAGKVLRYATQAFTFPSACLGPLQDSLVLDNDPVLGGPCLTTATAAAAAFDVLIVTNVFGTACDMDAYEAWAAAHGKLLVLDNAATPLTFGGPGGTTNMCDRGTLAIVSLHETKPIGRGEGGLVVCPDTLAATVRRAMNFGFQFGVPVRVHHPYASNWRISDIAAAFAVAFAETWTPEDVDAMTALSRVAEAAVAACGHLEWLWPPPPGRHVLACLPIMTRRGVAPVDVAAFVAATGIEAKKYYVPVGARAPVAEDWFARGVCLPLWRGLTPDTVTAMITALDAFAASPSRTP
jgi:dTDP-4-amino-4,6-dideoxygalactose transaminase